MTTYFLESLVWVSLPAPPLSSPSSSDQSRLSVLEERRLSGSSVGRESGFSVTSFSRHNLATEQQQQQQFLIGALSTSEDPKLHLPSMRLPFSEQVFHEDVCSLAAPVENNGYLPLFWSLITSPQGPHASTLSHKYPEFLTFEEGNFNICSPFLAALWITPFLCWKPQHLSIWLAVPWANPPGRVTISYLAYFMKHPTALWTCGWLYIMLMRGMTRDANMKLGWSTVSRADFNIHVGILLLVTLTIFVPEIH